MNLPSTGEMAVPSPIEISVVFRTCPEAIKMVPLVLAFQKDARFKSCIRVTAQHCQMLDQVLEAFEIIHDVELNLMWPNQILFDLTTAHRAPRRAFVVNEA